MKKILFILMFFKTITILLAQSFVNNINLGYNLNEGYEIGGFEQLQQRLYLEEEHQVYSYKSFIIDYLEKASPQLKYELNDKGGKKSEEICLFFDEKGIVVATRKYTKVVFSGANGLTSFLYNRKRLKRYSNDFDDWKMLEDVELSNLNRYFAVLYKGSAGLEDDEIHIYSIKDDLLCEERYYATSKYKPTRNVDNPLSNLEPKFNDFDYKDYYNKCVKMLKNKSLCACLAEKISKNIGVYSTDKEVLNLQSKFLEACYKKSNNISGDFKSKGIYLKNNIKSLDKYYSAMDNLNLRTKPTINSKVIIMIPKYDNVVLQGNYTNNEEVFSINKMKVEANWVEVKYGQYKGWVFAGGLEKESNDYEFFVGNGRVLNYIVGERMPQNPNLIQKDSVIIEQSEGFESKIPIKKIYSGNKFLFEVLGAYDLKKRKFDISKVGGINITNESFKTNRGIGVGSTLEEFFKAYPKDGAIGYFAESGLFSAISFSSGVYFYLNKKDFNGTLKNKKSGTPLDNYINEGLVYVLSISDFKPNSKIIKISLN